MSTAGLWGNLFGRRNDSSRRRRNNCRRLSANVEGLENRTLLSAANAAPVEMPARRGPMIVEVGQPDTSGQTGGVGRRPLLELSSEATGESTPVNGRSPVMTNSGPSLQSHSDSTGGSLSEFEDSSQGTLGEFSDTAPATVKVTLENGILTIEGTAKDDEIIVKEQDGFISLAIAGSTQKKGDLFISSSELAIFRSRDVKGIVISGGAGNDTIKVDASITQGAFISGGIGDDVIWGSGGDDIIWGGAGDDLILGFGGDDIIRGGSGRDALFGQWGNDSVYGDEDDRKIDGGLGDDMEDHGTLIISESSFTVPLGELEVIEEEITVTKTGSEEPWQKAEGEKIGPYEYTKAGIAAGASVVTMNPGPMYAYLQDWLKSQAKAIGKELGMSIGMDLMKDLIFSKGTTIEYNGYEFRFGLDTEKGGVLQDFKDGAANDIKEWVHDLAIDQGLSAADDAGVPGAGAIQEWLLWGDPEVNIFTPYIEYREK